MTDRYLSQSAYANCIGVSSTAVMKIKHLLDWVKLPGKKKPCVDTKGPKTLKYEAERAKNKIDNPELFRANEAAQNKKKDRPSPPPQPPINYEVPKDEVEEESLKDQKTKEEIEILKIKKENSRSILIRKEIVKKVFDRMYVIDQNQLKTLGVVVSPKISSVYNDANNIKTKKILDELKLDKKTAKTPILNILNFGEEENINQLNQIIEDSIGDILIGIQKEIDKFIKYTDEIENSTRKI